MALYREQPKCPKCGEFINGVYKNQDDTPILLVNIGDNFLYWDWSGHVCGNPELSSKDIKDTKTIGELLKQGRALMGMTLRQVEDATQISNAYLSQLETGKVKNPSMGVVKKLADLYGLDLSKLLDGQQPIVIVGNSHNITDAEAKELLIYLQFLRIKHA